MRLTRRIMLQTKGLAVIYEYRCYDAEPGRLADLTNRFGNVTRKYFNLHGVNALGFWTSEVGQSNQLHYLIQFASPAAREEAWAAFHGDQDWKQELAASNVNGRMVSRVRNQLWKPTTYSPLG